MKLFANIVNGLQLLTVLGKSSILNVWKRFEYAFADTKFIKANTSKWYRGIFKTLSNIYDEVFCGNSEQILAVNHFIKEKLHHKCLAGFRYAFCYGNLYSVFFKRSYEDLFIILRKCYGRVKQVSKMFSELLPSIVNKLPSKVSSF